MLTSLLWSESVWCLFIRDVSIPKTYPCAALKKRIWVQVFLSIWYDIQIMQNPHTLLEIIRIYQIFQLPYVQSAINWYYTDMHIGRAVAFNLWFAWSEVGICVLCFLMLYKCWIDCDIDSLELYKYIQSVHLHYHNLTC